MGVVGVLGLLIGSFAILSASVSSESSPPEYSAADGAAPALVLEVEHLKGKTARPKVKLEDVGVTVGAEENATLDWTMEVTTGNVSTASVANAPAWELGGHTEFNVSRAMGGWHFIEEFRENYRPHVFPCEEYIFNLRGSTVEWIYRWGKSGDKLEIKSDLTVDTQSPHHWTIEDNLSAARCRDECLLSNWWLYTWVTTDYANWAVLMQCNQQKLSSCSRLFILSRERTLPPATLEMLRNVAEQRGFFKSDGVLVEQTSGCSEGAEKAEENATLKTMIEVTTENVSTASVLNAPASEWVLGEQTAFNVSQATGGWHWIEAFGKDYRPRVDPCEEYIFNLTGSTVERTQRWGKSGDKLEIKGDFTVDTQSPHRWRDDWLSYTWLTTDYAKWGVLMLCRNKELSDCSTLHILSRERTLPPATLEILRNVTEQRGFPKSHGVPVDQTFCCSEAEENATLKRTMGVPTENVSTASVVNATAWELGGKTAFNVSQAVGVWRWIELFRSIGVDDTPDPCGEYIFNLRGSTVKQTLRWGNAGKKRESSNEVWTVDAESPHHWTSEGWAWTWMTTDYANSGVLMLCDTKELLHCYGLVIVSRERTLPPATMEMLRNVPEQRGFPKARGALVDQTSC